MVTLGKKEHLLPVVKRLKLLDQEKQRTQTVLQNFDEIAPRFVDRPGGYTRVYKLCHEKVIMHRWQLLNL